MKTASAPSWLVGIDEVGRGSLAGPVAVGVFAIRRADVQWLRGIKDSKQLSSQERTMWCKQLSALPHTYRAVAQVSAGHIDEHGIVHALQTALRRALGRIPLAHEDMHVLLDGGLYAPATYRNQTTIIRGDENEPAIAAASILAKVRRDCFMVRLHARFPEYRFHEHKGYGTQAHRTALRLFGPTPFHRRTFLSRVCV